MTILQFSLDHALQAKERAIEQVALNTDSRWRLAALSAVWRIADCSDVLTTDSVWCLLADSEWSHLPIEPRAMGAIMREAQRRGWIVPTADWKASVRVVNHARPIRIWASLICTGGTG